MSVVPHIDASVMATDSTGLQLLLQAGCFECYDTWRKAKVSPHCIAMLPAAICSTVVGVLRYHQSETQRCSPFPKGLSSTYPCIARSACRGRFVLCIGKQHGVLPWSLRMLQSTVADVFLCR